MSRTYDLNGNLHASSRTYYDGNPFEGLAHGMVTMGLPMRTAVWLRDADGSEYWINSDRKQYNDDGLVVATKDANGKPVELEYAITACWPRTRRTEKR